MHSIMLQAFRFFLRSLLYSRTRNTDRYPVVNGVFINSELNKWMFRFDVGVTIVYSCSVFLMWHLVCNRSTHTKLNMIGVENCVARWRLTLACRLCVYRNSRMQFYCHIDKRTFKTDIELRFPLFTCKIPTATNSQILKGIRAFKIKFSSHLMNGNEFSGRKQLMYDHVPDIFHRLWSTFLEIKTINRQTI